MATKGVYIIRNTSSSKVYIGSSASKGGIQERFRHHKSALKHDRHANKYLQKAYNKHGIDSFTYEILEECLAEKCLEREQHYLDLYKSYDPNRGYNLCEKAGNTLGRKHSAATRAKICHNRPSAFKGKKHSFKSLRKMSNSQKNSSKTQAHLLNLNTKKRRAVVGVNVSTGETIELDHMGADSRFTKGGINMCCRGKIQHYKGFKWSYKQL